MSSRLPAQDAEARLREQLKTLNDMQRELERENAALDFARETAKKLRAQARLLVEENALLRTRLATALMRAQRLEMRLHRRKTKR